MKVNKAINERHNKLWLDSLSAALFVHGFAIIAQTNQLQACPLWLR